MHIQVRTASKEKQSYKKIRELANTSNGYWIGSLDESCVEHAIYGSTEVTSPQIVLMSDGFMSSILNIQRIKLDDLIVMRKTITGSRSYLWKER